MALLPPAVDYSFADLQALLHAGTEHVNPLAAGDLRVEPEVLRDLTDQDQMLRLDVTAGHPRHHRVAAVLLNVGQEVVVGILQRGLLTVENVVGTGGGQDRSNNGFADIATLSAAEALQQAREGPDLGDGDDFEKLCTRLAEVLAQRLGLFHTLVSQQLFEREHTRAT